MNLHHAAAAAFAALTLSYAPNQARAQTPAQPAPPPCAGSTLSGIVADTTAALIPGARLDLDGGRFTQTSAPDGSFRFPCLARGTHKLVVSAPDFASRILTLTTPRNPLTLTLQPATVDTNVDVAAADTDGAATNTNTSGPTQTIAGKQLQQLADDPDDLLRELQQMASAAGGSNATIAVDGFQESTALPPKSSIAYIKVNPDLFSAEYREPPFEGGRIEVYTKPGQKAYHGALFATNGSSWENARDPFSTSSSPLGKQRYGFELTGPIRPHVRNGEGSDFALNLEHRSIDNFAVIDATTIDPTSGALTNISQNVPTPQRLWIGLARVDWQLGPKNTFIASYAANVSHLSNLGVGGNTLAESGYDSQKFDHMIRFSDVTSLSNKIMHESRLSLHLIRQAYTPVSTAPQLSVAGAFTGGGNTLGAQQLHWFTTEFDDDVILTPKHHTLKVGLQLINYDDHRQLPTNVNGSYTFGGVLNAPVLDANNHPTGQTTTLTGVQQYQRALKGLAGGAPTTYSAVTGSPTVNFDQLYTTLFAQDDFDTGHGLHIAYGLRYFTQTSPTTFSSLTPRLGLLWSPTKKGTFTLHAHTGLFSTQIGDGDYAEVLREDGVHRITTTLNSPTCTPGPFSPTTCNPTGTAIYSQRQLQPTLTQGSYAIQNIGGTYALPKGWNLSADYYYGRLWNMVRTRNINSPLTGSATGPRALGLANTNILQLQNSSQGGGSLIFVGLEQHTIKHLQLFFGSVRNALTGDSDNTFFITPQSSFTNAGEIAHRSGNGVWQTFGNATLTLPVKLQLSANYHGSGDIHYNLTTGFDNNNDGDLNDRPAYAPAGTPLCSVNPNANPCAYATRYGLLTASGVPGISAAPFVRRNLGVMPWTTYLDANLQRNFALNDPKSTHPQSLTLNVRSSNVLNHLNVTSVGGVLGSPQFGQPYAADNGRRIELGARYSF
jgi:hypothetical protein